MNLFDKKFVYLEWDDSLKGKKVVVGDLLQLMRRYVNDNNVKVRCVEDNGSNSDLYPFRDECGTEWAIVYYDPNYDIKLALKQGKVIQFRNKGDANWIDTNSPSWIDRCEYRVKQEEKKWRPFEDIQELKDTWYKRVVACEPLAFIEPMIWVSDKERPDITRLITDFNAGSNSVALAGHWCILEALFEDYTFLDGTPCGVKE